MSIQTIILLCVATLALGISVGYYLRYLRALSDKNSVELKIKEKILDAEKNALELTEKAEKKAEAIIAEGKKEMSEQAEGLKHKEVKLEKREDLLDERQSAIDLERKKIQQQLNEIGQKENELMSKKVEMEAEVEKIAGMTKQEAYKELVTKIETEQQEALNNRLIKLTQTGEEIFAQKAQNILLSAIHRLGNSFPTNFMTTSIELPNDEIKGKIIGKEGRNVRAFERITGVDVLIDDVPGYITLSSFDPIRREIARSAMETLLKDGRIQPAKIEECVEVSKHEVASLIKQMGEKATFEAQVPNLHPDLVVILGRLHFRTSYGQNVLWHSVEMANLAAILATEVGADVAVARAGALLHDIGKTVSHEMPGTHVEIGMRILRKYNVDEKVILAMRAHHEEYPYETAESIIVQVADSISGGRPGARHDSVEQYIKRLGDLEAIATSMAGVEQAFAIASGREIRIIVNPVKLNDLEALNLANMIAGEIEAQLRYPGEIKVHVIRETRSVTYAR